MINENKNEWQLQASERNVLNKDDTEDAASTLGRGAGDGYISILPAKA